MTLYLTRSGHVRGTSILVFCSNVAAKRFIATRSGPALSRSSNSSFSHIADKDFEGTSRLPCIRFLFCLDACDLTMHGDIYYWHAKYSAGKRLLPVAGAIGRRSRKYEIGNLYCSYKNILTRNG